MQTDTYDTALETAKQELRNLLTQFKQGVAEGEKRRAKESLEAFEKDILARQELCTQEFDSEMSRLSELKAQNPNRVQLYERAEQSVRKLYLSSMTFLCETLRNKIAQS